MEGKEEEINRIAIIIKDRIIQHIINQPEFQKEMHEAIMNRVPLDIAAWFEEPPKGEDE